MEKTNIGFAITGSFCTHEKILETIQQLVNKGHEVFPIVSEITAKTSTRFGEFNKFLSTLEKITGHKPFDSIVAVEPTGPQNLFEVLVVAPCTGNTLAKIANGINDTAVTMAVKAHVRNNKPVVIGISTNDGLGLNLKNLGTLFAAKNFYFVPFGQDDY
ncbi:MAG: dipicolinate synthase subunit B, partial [Clostridia bacterium]|nr:dipicolinate synthase subunit B [Clostridia bacterium]